MQDHPSGTAGSRWDTEKAPSMGTCRRSVRPQTAMDWKMNIGNDRELVKAAIIENIVESQILEAILFERGIPHRIRSYHDTAYDGLFQMQKGWGEVRTPAENRKEVRALLEEIRTNPPGADTPQQTTGGASMPSTHVDAATFNKALEIGRPPNIVHLFPSSRALIVSGKFVDLAALAKGKTIIMAANGRNQFVIRGVLRAAQRANAALIVEIAKSEGGTGAYCAVNYWNLARQVDALCNELGITIPVAIHADHYGLKSDGDVHSAKIEIPSIFDAGITSIAIDASHMPDDQNLLANLELRPFVPQWAGLETEIGEIKGKEGLSTREEALFLIQGLNAHDIFPNWIALNNGTTHGIEASDQGIQVDLTAEIHDALAPYKVSGAQHGTSGNSSDRLREIANRTRTTKANVATALQMISWGLEVNDYGNAILDDEGNFIKVEGEGVTEEMWKEMTAHAAGAGLKGGNFKKLNLPFENRLLAQPADVRERMVRRVEEFAFKMMTAVFNAGDTAPLAIEAILAAGSEDPGPKAQRIEDPAEWTRDKIVEKAGAISGPKGPEGDFDD
jgi:fructose/tagatose bisphosphate aldolase